MSLPSRYNLLAQHPNKYFVETGCYRGDAIQLALSEECKFEHIRSIDIDSLNVDFCMNRFDLYRHPDRKPINLYVGDSGEMLCDMISDIKEPITFWLDSHSQYLENEKFIKTPWPLLRELEQIADHPINNHTILIDDILILTHPDVTGWARPSIESYLYAINPKYQIDYIANPVRNNLLIAHL